MSEKGESSIKTDDERKIAHLREQIQLIKEAEDMLGEVTDVSRFDEIDADLEKCKEEKQFFLRWLESIEKVEETVEKLGFNSKNKELDEYLENEVAAMRKNGEFEKSSKNIRGLLLKLHKQNSKLLTMDIVRSYVFQKMFRNTIWAATLKFIEKEEKEKGDFNEDDYKNVKFPERAEGPENSSDESDDHEHSLEEEEMDMDDESDEEEDEKDIDQDESDETDDEENDSDVRKTVRKEVPEAEESDESEENDIEVQEIVRREEPGIDNDDVDSIASEIDMVQFVNDEPNTSDDNTEVDQVVKNAPIPTKVVVTDVQKTTNKDIQLDDVAVENEPILTSVMPNVQPSINNSMASDQPIEKEQVPRDMTLIEQESLTNKSNKPTDAKHLAENLQNVEMEVENSTNNEIARSIDSPPVVPNCEEIRGKAPEKHVEPPDEQESQQMEDNEMDFIDIDEPEQNSPVLPRQEGENRGNGSQHERNPVEVNIDIPINNNAENQGGDDDEDIMFIGEEPSQKVFKFNFGVTDLDIYMDKEFEEFRKLDKITAETTDWRAIELLYELHRRNPEVVTKAMVQSDEFRKIFMRRIKKGKKKLREMREVVEEVGTNDDPLYEEDSTDTNDKTDKNVDDKHDDSDDDIQIIDEVVLDSDSDDEEDVSGLVPIDVPESPSTSRNTTIVEDNNSDKSNNVSMFSRSNDHSPLQKRVRRKNNRDQQLTKRRRVDKE